MSVRVGEGADEQHYLGAIVTIRSTFFGVEDHGILTTYLEVEEVSRGIRQIGGYGLDDWNETQQKRVPTAYGLSQLYRIMEVAGVSQWEKLSGRTLLLLSLPDSSQVRGISDLTGERVLLFNDHWKDWHPEATD